MKRINIYLSIGLILVLFFLTMMTFPSLFTDKSPYDISGVQSYQTEEGNYAFRTPPFEPSDRFILGSDDSGRDVLSFVIYGAQLTLMIGLSVAILRFLLGLIFGISASLDHSMSGLLVNQFNNVFNAIPPLIICIIVLSVGYLKSLSKSYSVMVFILVMTLVEWARVAIFVRERSSLILEKDFIKSERIIGKSDGRIVIEHLLPHMFSELVVLFFMEISRVLTLMMQLGIFGIFIGNLKIVLDTGAGFIVGKSTSFEPEWASMLGSSKNYIRLAPWIVLSCALAFFTSVLGFNFVGEGLRMVYQEGEQVFKNKKQQAIILSVIVLIFVFGLVSTYEPAVASADYLSGISDLPNQGLVGTKSGKRLADEIRDQFKEMDLGMVKGQYQYPYKLPTYKHVKSADLFVETEDLSYRIEDFGLLTYSSFTGEGPVLDLRSVSPMGLDLTSSAFQTQVADKFLILDGDMIDEDGWLYFSEKLMKGTECLGVIIPAERPKDKYVGITALEKPVINLRQSQCDAIIDKKLKISIESEVISGQGINVVGQLSSPSTTEETKGVILGFSYNYLDKEIGEAQLKTALEVVGRLKANEARLKRNITVVFWDGGLDKSLSGMNSYYTEYYYPIKHTMVYIDLQGLYGSSLDERALYLNDDYITMAKPDAYSMVNYLKGTLDQADHSQDIKESYSVFFHKRGIQTLYLGVEDHISNQEMRDSLIDALVETLLKEIY